MSADEKGDRYADRFTIVQLAGSGGTANVYQAFDDENRCLVALKIYDKASADLDVVTELWNREVAALSRLKHEAVAELLDAGRDNEAHHRFIVLEWVDGEPLEKFLERVGKLTWPEFQERLGTQILTALEFAAERDICHRDLSPSNVLVAAKGAVKIVDFGQARISQIAIGRTVAGWRTAPYCPPEEDTGTYTYTRDPYSFCAIATRALAGHSIKDHDALYDAFDRIDLPDFARGVLTRALSRNPKERFANSIEFRTALEADAKNLEEITPLTVPVRFIPGVFDRLQTADEDEEPSIEDDIVGELNDAVAVSPAKDTQSGQNRLELETQSYRMIVDIDSSRADHLVVVHLTPKRFRLDSLYQGERWNPAARFTLSMPHREAERAATRQSLESFYRALEEFQIAQSKVRRRPSGGAVDEWGRLLDALRYIARHEVPALRYSRLESDGRWLTATVENPEDANEEEVRTISIEGGRWVFRGEIDRISGNQCRLVSTRPRIDLEAIPQRGILEIDWQQTRVALDRQARAVERFKTGDLPNPALGKMLTGDNNGLDEPAFALLQSFFDPNLDPPKKEVVSRCATGIDLLVTHGPPGTGKTKLIVELIRQALHANPESKILLVSQTHAALDNALERLLKSEPNVSCVRIGSGSKEVDPRVLSCTVEQRGKALRDQVDTASRAFIERRATNLGVSRFSIEVALRSLDLIGLRRSVEQAKRRQTELDDEQATLKRSIESAVSTADRSAERAKLRTLGTEAEKVIAQTQLAEAQLSVAVERLSALGPEGLALSSADNRALQRAADVLDQGREQQKLGSLIQLSEDWRLRFGQSDDFRTAIIASSSIVAGTCVGFCREEAASRATFDLCIIDEAGKATTTELLVPLAQARRAVIVGDHHQLPAVIDNAIHTPELQDRFGITPRQVQVQLFEELTQELAPGNRATLSVQYRMRGAIGSLVGACFYDGQLTTDESANTRPVLDLSLAGLTRAVTWLDPYAGTGAQRFEERHGTSYSSPREVACVVALLRRIAFVSEHARTSRWPSVAVITGYAQQANHIRSEIRRDAALDRLGVECATVHAFQGREVDICIYSVARKNREHRIGMISDWRHLNVALSRARDFLVVVGSIDFCRNAAEPNPFRSIVDFIERSSECEAKEWSDD